jgi:hypothetical protein
MADEAIVGDDPEIAAIQTPDAAQEPEPDDDEIADVEPSGDDDATDEGDAEDAEGEDEGPDDTGDDDDEIELNIAGNIRKFSAKASAKEVAQDLQIAADQMWQAHTRRSQEVADRDKSIKARAEALDKIQTYDDEAFKLYAAAKSYDETAAALEQQLAQIDRRHDPDGYRFASDDLVRYRQAAQQAKVALSDRETMAANVRAAELQRTREAGRVAVQKALGKSFDENAVIDYASKSYGIDRKALAETWPDNPAVTQMAYKAMRWDQMQEKGRASKQPQPKQPEPVRARAKKGAPTTAADLLTAPGKADAYHKLRMARLAARR